MHCILKATHANVKGAKEVHKCKGMVICTDIFVSVQLSVSG